MGGWKFYKVVVDKKVEKVLKDIEDIVFNNVNYIEIICIFSIIVENEQVDTFHIHI